MYGLSSSTTFRAPSKPHQWPSHPKQRRGADNQSPQKKRRHRPITAQIDLKPPPFPLNALEPHMSKETMEVHWGRHHRGHVESLNRQIAGTELDGMGLENIVMASYNNGDPLPTFDHAAQIWNHEFFWQSMKPGGGGRPSGDLLELIERDFGSLERMLMEFNRVAVTQFGSGWAWLVYKANRLNVGNAVNPCPSDTDNKLVVTNTPNAVNPLVWDYSPLLVLDVWEHAYYLDHENRRADYVSVFLKKLVSWEVVSSRLEMATARAAERARGGDERGEGEGEEDMVMVDSGTTEVYLDSENDGSESE